jgi:HPt (histidine-containing phosphotransfer) domain-containing protein
MDRIRRIATSGTAANDGTQPGAQSPAESAVVNAEVIADLEALGSTPGFVERLVRAFWNDNLRLLARMESALGGRELDEFRNHLRTMRGAAAGMGAERLTGVCRELGRLSDAEIRLRMPALARLLRQELEATRSALENCLQEHRKSAV